MIDRIDKIDLRILALLQQNARTPLKALAAKVFLSSPAVSSRILKLENKGIIRGYHADIDPAALGYHLQAFVSLTLEKGGKEDFIAFAKNCHHIIECHCTTGHDSIMMKVMFCNTQELDDFVTELSRFGSTDSHIIFSTLKKPYGIQSLYPELDK